MENPAQQVQWQNGEQSSACPLSFWQGAFVISVLNFSGAMANTLSAQGMQLSANTIIPMMKPEIFMLQS